MGQGGVEIAGIGFEVVLQDIILQNSFGNFLLTFRKPLVKL